MTFKVGDRVLVTDIGAGLINAGATVLEPFVRAVRVQLDEECPCCGRLTITFSSITNQIIPATVKAQVDHELDKLFKDIHG